LDRKIATNPVAPSASSGIRWFREPLLHFLLIGMALFVVWGKLNPAQIREGGMSRIVITEDDLVQFDQVWRAKWQRPPTPQELVAMVDNKIKEEILYREALAMGLDRDDSIIKRRLAQKMAFLGEDVSGIQEPTADEIRDWYERHSGTFALPERGSFRHLYFSIDARGDAARDAALQALEILSGKAGNDPATKKLGDPFMFQDYYGDRSPVEVASDFGGQFTEALFQLEPGSWQGPVESGLGWHLVFINTLTPGRIPALEEVSAQVRNEWVAEQREKANTRAFAAMRERYEIVLPVDLEPLQETYAGLEPEQAP